MDAPDTLAEPTLAVGTMAERGVFANRTLNLRSVAAIGYDMDYTLIHYRTEEWEGVAFEHARRGLAAAGFPVEGLVFEPDRFIQGLVIDLDLGHLIKATRFGYVVKAYHGTRALSFDELRTAYAGVVVDLAEPRFEFLNTLFSISEAALYAQLVDRLDAGEFTSDEVARKHGPMGYDELYRTVIGALDASHATGALKAEIMADPDRFCVLDEEIPATLLDQRLAGKRLLLITNSGWPYTQPMMRYAFDGVLATQAPGTTWRDLFDLVVVAADKPRFFVETPPAFRMVDTERGLLEPHYGPYQMGNVYHGGSAALVEQSFGLSGDEILYVGDHLFGDVHVTKRELHWRTALILREIEAEIADAEAFAADEAVLRQLMGDKRVLEDHLSALRLAGLKAGTPAPEFDQLYADIRRLDEQIAPYAIRAGALGNHEWGPLMRAGNDKSLFARQVEKYADVYTSRVSNLLARTPFAYLRATRTSLPHDL
ncbi:MAG TPA: HAD-IG family 5'-nucleotidase [Ilumatobacter sp.]|nr:HAD-IG family 5'-nucleotidase [Ilumatobacter sp.]